MRETVEAIEELSGTDGMNELTESEVATKLQLDKSTTSRRIDIQPEAFWPWRILEV